MYKLLLNVRGETDAVIRLSDNAGIPLNPDNTDYQEYLKWVANGGLPHPADFVEPSNESSVVPLPADNTEGTV